MNKDSLDFYAAPGRFTTLGDGEFSSSDIREVVKVVQGLLVRPAYRRGLDVGLAAAALTVDPDARFAALRARYETDDSFRMDGTVFNLLHNQLETV